MGQTILVLGGGVGGLVAASELRKALAKEHRVVLVERERDFVFAPSFLWLLTGDRSAEQIARPLDRLARKGIEVVRGEVQRIDPARREAVVGGKTLAGDHLIIALGAELAPETIPGLVEAGHDFYTLRGAEGLRDAFAAFSGGKLVVLTAAPAYKCPAAPYEAVMLLEAALRKRKLRDRTQIEMIAAEPGPMGTAGPEVSKALRALVEAKGIVYRPEHQIVRADPVARRLEFASGATADYDLLGYVPPHRAPRAVREAGFAAEPAPGWIPVDRATFATRFERVWAIGDVTTVPLKLGKPLPKAGVFAHGQAEVVAHNVACAITGKGKPRAYAGDGECFIEVGDGKAGIGKGNFYAEPLPVVQVKPPGRRWHAAKIVFEKYWLHHWF